MPINNQIHDTSTLYRVLVDSEMMEPPSNYWLGLGFGQTIQFTEEYIDFARITDNRKLAPLVVPTAQGVPIYSAAESVTRVKPAYVKPKDPVTASRVIKRAAGFGELPPGAQAMSPQQRYMAIVADILRQHRRSIERRWEWLAAEATIHGKVTLVDDNYPERVVDFQRDPAHTVSLTVGNRWGDAGVSILGLIEGWRKLMRRAKHGGPANRLTLGADAWEVLRQDPEIRELLKTDYRPQQQGGLDLNLGLVEGLDVEHVGRLSGTLDVYVYSDYYQDPDGTVKEFMSPKDAVLTGPSMSGVRCFAAIQDVASNFQPLAMFPKMWSENDPSATFVMTQSAPLMVPVNPNASFRATVVA